MYSGAIGATTVSLLPLRALETLLLVYEREEPLPGPRNWLPKILCCLILVRAGGTLTHIPPVVLRGRQSMESKANYRASDISESYNFGSFFQWGVGRLKSILTPDSNDTLRLLHFGISSRFRLDTNIDVLCELRAKEALHNAS